jgi:hypothetical protein
MLLEARITLFLSLASFSLGWCSLDLSKYIFKLDNILQNVTTRSMVNTGVGQFLKLGTSKLGQTCHFAATVF